MASQANKDILTRLADRGEQVVGRISDLPGAKAIMDSTTSLGKRIDEMQKRIRKIEPLEKRVDQLEGKPKRAPAKRKPAAKAPAKKPAAGKPAT